MIKVNAHTLNYLSSDANINVIATLEDSFNTTPWEQTFEFNSKDSGDDGKIVSPIVTPVNPAIR